MTVTARFATAYSFHRRLWHILDWIYPPRCASCEKPGFRLCPDCINKTKVINQQNVCPVCGVPKAGYLVCEDCEAGPPTYAAVRSWGLYEGPLRKSIHQLKYHSNLGISQDLAGLLSQLLAQLPWQVDLVVPVPLSRERQRERGYNQSSLLARWVCMMNGIHFAPNSLSRIKHTASQVGLTGVERRKNVADAFIAETSIVSGQAIVVIDDVSTTGATMQACANALTEAGASRIYGLTLARAGQIHLS